jgi:hypothetical protein
MHQLHFDVQQLHTIDFHNASMKAALFSAMPRPPLISCQPR